MRAAFSASRRCSVAWGERVVSTYHLTASRVAELLMGFSIISPASENVNSEEVYGCQLVMKLGVCLMPCPKSEITEDEVFLQAFKSYSVSIVMVGHHTIKAASLNAQVLCFTAYKITKKNRIAFIMYKKNLCFEQ